MSSGTVCPPASPLADFPCPAGVPVQVVDLSRATAEVDFHPSRRAVIAALVEVSATLHL